MSLKQWAENGWLRPHRSSPREIADLLAIVERDIRDAEGEISAGWRFGIAYNAALAVPPQHKKRLALLSLSEHI